MSGWNRTILQRNYYDIYEKPSNPDMYDLSISGENIRIKRTPYINRYGVLKIVTVTFLSRTNLACQHFFKDNQNVRNQLKSVFYKNIIFA